MRIQSRGHGEESSPPLLLKILACPAASHREFYNPYGTIKYGRELFSVKQAANKKGSPSPPWRMIPMGVRNHVTFFQSQTLLPDSLTSHSVPSKRAEVLSISLSFGNGNPRRQVTCSGPFTSGISVVSPVLFLSHVCDQDWDLESCRGSSENVMLLKGLDQRHGGFTGVTRQKPIFSLQKISDCLMFSFQDENRKIFTSLKLEVKGKKKKGRKL